MYILLEAFKQSKLNPMEFASDLNLVQKLDNIEARIARENERFKEIRSDIDSSRRELTDSQWALAQAKRELTSLTKQRPEACLMLKKLREEERGGLSKKD